MHTTKSTAKQIKPRSRRPRRRLCTTDDKKHAITTPKPASPLPALDALHQAVREAILCSKDTGIDEGSDTFSLDSTFKPERRIVIYLLGKLPKAVLITKKSKYDGTRHDERFAVFDMSNQIVALRVIKKWMKGESLSTLKKYIIAQHKHFDDFEFFYSSRFSSRLKEIK